MKKRNAYKHNCGQINIHVVLNHTKKLKYILNQGKTLITSVNFEITMHLLK